MISVVRIYRIILTLWLAVLTGLMSASAWAADEDDEAQTDYLFYPSPPDEPRIQFLTSFSAALDVSSGESKFRDFVFGGKENEGHLVGKPYGLGIHNGVIFVVDTRGNGWGLFDVANRKAAMVRPGGGGSLSKPINMAIDQDGTKYVTDTQREQIVVYDAANRHVRVFGKKGQFKPADVAIVGDRLYVTDNAHDQVHVLDKVTGETLLMFGESGDEPGQLRHPTNLTIAPDETLYVVDSTNFRVQQFSLDGEFIRAFGEAGTVPGTFSRPKGIAIDREGYIYVVDSAFENIQIFAQDGGALMFFGAPGDARDSINLPTVVKIDYDNVRYFEQYAAPDFEIEYLILVASQFGVNKVSVFGYGSIRE